MYLGDGKEIQVRHSPTFGVLAKSVEKTDE
jgi:hypothetical protein